VSQPGRRRPAPSRAADHLRSRPRTSFGQTAARRDKAGHATYQLVRARPQGHIRQDEMVMCLLHLVAFQMHVCERNARSPGALCNPVFAVLGRPRCLTG
jgi:hypothetical protein